MREDEDKDENENDEEKTTSMPDEHRLSKATPTVLLARVLFNFAVSFLWLKIMLEY